jgi:hypothetical protein
MVLACDSEFDRRFPVKIDLQFSYGEVVPWTGDNRIRDQQVSNKSSSKAVPDLLHFRVGIESSTKPVPSQRHWVLAKIWHEQVDMLERTGRDLVGEKPGEKGGR